MLSEYFGSLGKNTLDWYVNRAYDQLASTQEGTTMTFNIGMLNTARTIDGTVAAEVLEEQIQAALPSNYSAVAQGDSVNVENSAGNLDSPATAQVTNKVLTSVRLAATKTIVTNAQVFAGVTGTGTTATITVANGVITAIALS